MIRNLPVLPTILVLLAVGTMISLGFWQLDRKAQKEELIARYRTSQAMSADVRFPMAAEAVPDALFRHSSLECGRVVARRTTAGRRSDGVAGLAQMVTCDLAGGGRAEIALGWSPSPELAAWDGGPVSGFVAPAGKGARLVAAPPAPGLQQLALPDPSTLPNNHLAYAGQWFLFAATALVIYVLALRGRGRKRSRPV